MTAEPLSPAEALGAEGVEKYPGFALGEGTGHPPFAFREGPVDQAQLLRDLFGLDGQTAFSNVGQIQLATTLTKLASIDRRQGDYARCIHQVCLGQLPRLPANHLHRGAGIIGNRHPLPGQALEQG